MPFRRKKKQTTIAAPALEIAPPRANEISAVVQCISYNCEYWGEMEGYWDEEFVIFTCPECSSINKVKLRNV